MSIKAKSGLSAVSIVMIAYNEAKTIKGVLLEYYQEIFLKLPSGSEFILYLDKPTDSTANIVSQLAKKIKIKVIHGEVNLKYAGAMRKALGYAKNELVFFSDSSGKHRAKDFWALLAQIHQFDIVNGFRQSRGDSFVRQLVTDAQRYFVAWYFKIPLHDYNTGYKLFRKSVLTKLLSQEGVVRYTASTELMIRSLALGYRVGDIPVEFVGRKFKHTGTQLYQLITMSLDSFNGYRKIKKQLQKRKIYSSAA